MASPLIFPGSLSIVIRKAKCFGFPGNPFAVRATCLTVQVTGSFLSSLGGASMKIAGKSRRSAPPSWTATKPRPFSDAITVPIPRNTTSSNICARNGDIGNGCTELFVSSREIRICKQFWPLPGRSPSKIQWLPIKSSTGVPTGSCSLHVMINPGWLGDGLPWKMIRPNSSSSIFTTTPWSLRLMWLVYVGRVGEGGGGEYCVCSDWDFFCSILHPVPTMRVVVIARILAKTNSLPVFMSYIWGYALEYFQRASEFAVVYDSVEGCSGQCYVTSAPKEREYFFGKKFLRWLKLFKASLGTYGCVEAWRTAQQGCWAVGILLVPTHFSVILYLL